MGIRGHCEIKIQCSGKLLVMSFSLHGFVSKDINIVCWSVGIITLICVGFNLQPERALLLKHCY